MAASVETQRASTGSVWTRRATIGSAMLADRAAVPLIGSVGRARGLAVAVGNRCHPNSRQLHECNPKLHECESFGLKPLKKLERFNPRPSSSR